MNILNYVKPAALGLTAAVFTAAAAFAGPMTTEYKDYKAPVEPAPEPEPWWGASLTFGYDSQYIFRGVNILGDDGQLVWTDLSFSAHGFTLGVWYADGVNESEFDDYTELNVYLDYTYATDTWFASVGYIFYHFPDTSLKSTNEIYGGLGYTGFQWVTPSVFAYWDFDELEGVYLEATLESSIPVYEDIVSIDPWVKLGVDFEYNSDDTDLNDFEVGVAVPIALNDHITLKGYGAYRVALDAIDDFQEDDEFWGGAEISFSF